MGKTFIFPFSQIHDYMYLKEYSWIVHNLWQTTIKLVADKQHKNISIVYLYNIKVHGQIGILEKSVIDRANIYSTKIHDLL